jgi:FkbM family methyltransferase
VSNLDAIGFGDTPAWSTRRNWEDRVKNVGRRLGVEVSRWRPPERRLAEYLEEHNIHTVLDVGASGGQFGRMLRAAGFRGRIVSFEPLLAPFEALSRGAAPDSLWEVHRLALGDERGRRAMYVSSNTTSSSFLELENRHVDALAESRFVAHEEVDIERLDQLASTLQLVGPTFLKIDVQGYHSTVLRGAAGMLSDVAAIQCELSVLPLYSGEPGFLEVLAELRSFGFELTELEPGFYDARTGRILQFDGRFSRPVTNSSSATTGNQSSI